MSYKITQISQAVKNSERVNIYLNGKLWIGLSKNDLLSLRLVTDQEITELEKGEIEKTALDSHLIARVINLIQLRPRSSGEIKDYLVYKKSIPAQEAESVIAYLQDKGYISDEKFAQWYIDYKLTSGVNGINKIKMTLMMKKVDKKIIDEIIERLYSSDDFKSDQAVIIEEYAKKIIKTIKAKDAYDLKSKLTQRLMARGFKYSDIKEVLKQQL
jgi:regulatory protein